MTRDRAQLAGKIRSARMDKGWKQKHLAAEVHVEPITVSRWERGATTPDFDALSVIAKATGKPVSYFVGDDESANPSLAEAAERLEAAADRIATQAERIAAELAELRGLR